MNFDKYTSNNLCSPKSKKSQFQGLHTFGPWSPVVCRGMPWFWFSLGHQPFPLAVLKNSMGTGVLVSGAGAMVP